MTALGVSLHDLTERGIAHDWERYETLATSPNTAQITLRRLSEQRTPDAVYRPDEAARFATWPEPTHTRAQFLTFTVHRTIKHRQGQRLEDAFHVRGNVLYGDAYSPWNGRRDSTISQRAAYEILEASPTV